MSGNAAYAYEVNSHHTAALPDDVHTVVPTIHIKTSAGFVTLSFLTHEDQGWSKRLKSSDLDIIL